MKEFKFKRGVKQGVQRYCPNRGLVTLNTDLSDAIAEEFIAAGVTGIFEKVKAPKPEKNNGKESIKDFNEGASDTDS